MGLIKLIAGISTAAGAVLTLVLLGAHECNKKMSGLFKDLGGRGWL